MLSLRLEIGIIYLFFLNRKIKATRWFDLLILEAATRGVLCEKVFLAFDFDEKLTQGVAQLTKYYHVSKDFLPCTLRLVRCLQFQGMIWKTEECRVSLESLEISQNSQENFAKFLKTPFLTEHLRWLLLGVFDCCVT